MSIVALLDKYLESSMSLSKKSNRLCKAQILTKWEIETVPKMDPKFSF